MVRKPIYIDDYDYDLPEQRVARFPLQERDASKLLVYRSGKVSEAAFSALPELLPEGSLLVFNNTKVVRARMVFFKESGARIEIFCLEPHEPADYERAFAQKGECSWSCIVGNSRKWKSGHLAIRFPYGEGMQEVTAERLEDAGRESVVRFRWAADLTFGQLLELLGTIPIPPYLNRESQEIDNTRYQTVYSRFEGSVAAPTAGLHFTERVIERLHARGIPTAEVTLHVGAGTFLPVKAENAVDHPMHTEHFEVTLDTLRRLEERMGRIVAVGTTSVRTLESLPVLGYRVLTGGDPGPGQPVGQWEAYDIPPERTGAELIRALADYLHASGRDRIRSATRIMITPGGFRFRVVDGLVTNFHQPKSTLLLLISAFVGGDWKTIYRYALEHGFRFLSYGDSSLLWREKSER